MSIETPDTQTASASTLAVAPEQISKSKNPTRPTETPKQETKDQDTSKSSLYSPANLLSGLLSPFSFSGTSLGSNTTSPSSEEKEKEKENERDITKPATKISIEPSSSGSTTEATPEPYFTVEDTPLFKTLAKTRLTRTRTKQLLRAGERAYNDPPPPPGLGDCCGSSCDPCVRDLWKQEIGIWRERWGDRAVEEGGKLEKTEQKEEKPGKKDLEW